MLKQKNLIVLLSLLVLVSCNCCSTEFDHNNPQPFTSAEEYVLTAVYHWLDVRIDNLNWTLFSDPKANWRQATTFPPLYLSLSYLGNLERKINDIKNSSRFQIDSEERLFTIVHHALTSFIYVE
jgi:hypothetical protein